MKRSQKITRTALLTAVCVVLGYLFLPIPNLEMITAGIFFSGSLMGPFAGGVIGALAETIYSTSNPVGFPPITLLSSQILSMSLIGILGGVTARWFLETDFYTRLHIGKQVVLGFLGAILTLIYDILTTLSFPLTAGFNWQQIRITLIMSIPFSLFHIISNTVVFALILPIFYKRVKTWRTA